MSLTEIWLRLMLIRDLNGEKCLKIARFLKTCSVINDESLAASGLNTRSRRLFNSLTGHQLAASLRWLEAPDHALINADSPDYPALLRTLPDFPCALFVSGSSAALNQQQIAVVGSRNISDYGERSCRAFCEPLARAGLTITSGLALGIDGVAHRSALAVSAPTVAVLGNGLDAVYPRRHAQLAAQIVAQSGAIISEFPLGTPPLPYHFPWRNRIISGLSRAVLVIEADERSGSLVTARYAAEQGREIFALPGLVESPGSRGPHRLIQQGANLVCSPDDILNYLESELAWLPVLPPEAIYSANQPDCPLPIPELLANVGDEVTPVDVVAERAGQPVPETVAQLLELELAGWIAAVPGGYVRLRRACHVRRTNVLI